MQQTKKPPLFPLGQIVATPGALAALEKAGQQPHEFLARHVHGEWGDVPCAHPVRKHRAGEMLRMQESYGEGVAIHTGSESCVTGRKASREALTGETTGQGE
ncbi:MAG: hypothetical protein ACYDDI_15680 [Candidatus Acidiferrales bacterium]